MDATTSVLARATLAIALAACHAKAPPPIADASPLPAVVLADAAVERDAGGEPAIVEVHPAAAKSRITFGRAHRFIGVGDLLIEVTTGRELFLPHLSVLARSETRALSVDTSPARASAALVDLATGGTLVEREVDSPILAHDEDLTVLVAPMTGVVPDDADGFHLAWIGANAAAPLPLEGEAPVMLAEIDPCPALVDVCPWGTADVSGDGARALWVSRDPAGDVLHVRARAGDEQRIALAGHRIKALRYEPDLRTLAVASDAGEVRTYHDGAPVARFARTVTGTLGVSADGRRIAWTEGEEILVDDGRAKPVAIHVGADACGGPLRLALARNAVFTRSASGDIGCSGSYDLGTRKGRSSTTVTPGDDYPREKEDLALAAVVGWALGGTGHGDTPVIARAGSLALVRPDRPVVVDGKTGKELARLVTAGACRAETMALDAEWAACVGDDGRPRVWIARSGKLLFTGEAEGRRRCVGARSAAVVPCGGNL